MLWDKADAGRCTVTARERDAVKISSRLVPLREDLDKCRVACAAAEREDGHHLAWHAVEHNLWASPL